MKKHKLLANAEEIQEKLCYKFQDKKLLELAFTHRSFVNENKDLTEEHNERLEFLGDAVLELLVSEFLFRRKPNHREGDLTLLRSRLVDASSCKEFISLLEIGDFLLLGKGERKNQGKGRETLYSDLFEALLGAIYLDGGLERTRTFFFERFSQMIEEIITNPAENWKALLQDFVQKGFQKQPIYHVVDSSGPDHEKIFHVEVCLDDKVLGSGQGLSKKQAEQKAAENALLILKKEAGDGEG